MYVQFWGKALEDNNLSRLQFYSQIKKDFSFETYLELPDYSQRKIIAKLRCSDHALEIEKGRHKKIHRQERMCKVCIGKEIETKDHFLTKCKFYDKIKTKYKTIPTNNSLVFIRDTNSEVLGKYLLDAFDEREKALNETPLGT